MGEYMDFIIEFIRIKADTSLPSLVIPTFSTLNALANGNRFLFMGDFDQNCVR